MDLNTLKDKKVAILGLGVEGLTLARFLAGKAAEISILDKLTEGELKKRAKEEDNKNLKNILINQSFKKILGNEYLNNLENFDIVFRSPGLPYLHNKIQEAKKRGVIISSQIKLFFDLCPCSIIGVTGTKGKGTTASLIFEILRESTKHEARNSKQISAYAKASADKQNSKLGNSKSFLTSNFVRPEADHPMAETSQLGNAYLAGNIGIPAISLIDRIKKGDVVVLELSSFQLQDLEKSPHVAVVLNISLDHLDYHQNKVEYKEAKLPIVKYQTEKDYAIINADYFTSFEFSSQTEAEVYYFSRSKVVDQGCYIKRDVIPRLPAGRQGKNTASNTANNEAIEQLNNDSLHLQKEVVLKIDDREEVICRSDEVKLIGEHNLENIAAAAITAKLAGADIESIKQVAKSFSGLSHRLEFIRAINGVKFYDDSFATNPEPTIAAIKSFLQPIILILGGSSKGADFEHLAKEIIKSSVKSVVLIGDEAKKIKLALERHHFLGKIVDGGKTITQIVNKAKNLAEKGDVVLLSPACASFGLFKNYKDRGDKFKEEVKKFDRINSLLSNFSL